MAVSFRAAIVDCSQYKQQHLAFLMISLSILVGEIFKELYG
jgi:hypothetical protein